MKRLADLLRPWPFLLLLLALARPALAATDDNGSTWLMYLGDHAFGRSKWGVHVEGHWRRADLVNTGQFWVGRIGANYQLKQNLLLTVAYTFLGTHPYGAHPAAGNSHEHRALEQVLYTARLGRRTFTNRLRLEQRYIGVLGPALGGGAHILDYRYQNRFRYWVKTTFPLRHSRNYVALSDEIMFNFGKNVDRNVFDQNRAYVAWGHNVGEASSVEFGFMEQYAQRPGGVVFERNHTLVLMILSRLPFGAR